MKKIFLLFSFFSFISLLYAQELLKSTKEEYFDFLALQGIIDRPTLGYRTLSDSVWYIPQEIDHIWKNINLNSSNIVFQKDSSSENCFLKGLNQELKYKIFGPILFNSYNSAVPYGQNDGALWQGNGFNTYLDGGIRLESYGFELTILPQLSWSQNLPFEINNDIYKNPYSFSFTSTEGKFIHLIDYVQRYGDNSFYEFSFGDTEIRWNWNALTLGFGTQSPWLGPSQINPMLGSNNATPYVKFDAGLRKMPVILPYIDLNLGNIEGRIWTGKLQSSEYFPYKPQTNKRMLNAMTASYEPSFIPGLILGLNRVFITRWRTENLSYIFRLFTLSRSNALTSSGNDEDQKFSLFIDWILPKSSFEVYGEFGRDDFSSNENTNPFHTAIYTVGARQVINLPYGLQSLLSFELNNFELSQDFQMQWPYLGFYAHGDICQGYTNNGQIIGAGSGTFGNSQLVSYKTFFSKGSIELFYHRYCPNNNSIYSINIYNVANTNSELYKNWYANFETWNCFGINGNYFITPKFLISLEYVFINIEQRNYKQTNSVYNNYAKIKLEYSY